MKRFLRCTISFSRLARQFLSLIFGLMLAAPAFAQTTGNSPWENAVNVLQQAFTSTIARGLRRVRSDLRLRRRGLEACPRRRPLWRWHGYRGRQLHGLAVSMMLVGDGEGA